MGLGFKELPKLKAFWLYLKGDAPNGPSSGDEASCDFSWSLLFQLNLPLFILIFLFGRLLSSCSDPLKSLSYIFIS
jgi:hypothetical protein